MSSATSKVLVGCGLGCLVVVVGAGALGWMGYRWAQDAVVAVESAAETEQELEERFGRVRDYCPSLDPEISVERIEAFLFVRESLDPAREELADSVAEMAPAAGGGGIVGGFRSVGAGMRMAPRALELAHVRNDALLEVGMGLGEYIWLYSLTYHSWLGHPPSESPLHDSLSERSASESSVQMHIDGDLDPERMTRHLRSYLLDMLHNLDHALEDEPEREAWRELVRAEIEFVEADFGRVPWQDGLPPEMTAGLEAYRDRLEASYSPATNIFELVELE